MLGVTLLDNITSGPTSKAAFGPEASSCLLLRNRTFSSCDTYKSLHTKDSWQRQLVGTLQSLLSQGLLLLVAQLSCLCNL